MPFDVLEKTDLEQLKLFAAIFLDGELGGGPLEGLDLTKVADNIIYFLNSIKHGTNYQDKYHLSLGAIEKIQFHLAQISTINQFQVSNDTNASAKLIFDAFEKEHDVFFPGGWMASPAGHAMIYRLFQDQNGDVVFLGFNTGAGAQYHKKISPANLATIKSEHYKEKFNPVYALRFNNHEKIKEYGGLQAWIKKLVEPNVLPLHDHTYTDNNAEGIYERIFAASAYLGGEVIDPTPYFAHTTSGQRSGTCAQQATQKMLRGFFTTDTDYDRFILDYRLYVLHDFLTTQKLPKTYKKEFDAAVANTARMITTGKELEQQLDLNDKKVVVEQLTKLKIQADIFFNTTAQEEPLEKIEIVDSKMHVAPLSWMPGDTPKADKSPKKMHETPGFLFDKTGSFIDAINSLDQESKQADKRTFVHHIEQLCFTFCDQFKDFKDRPFPQENTSEDWAQAIVLLHKYSIEYFDFYFKNKSKCRDFNYLFEAEEDGEHGEGWYFSSAEWKCASPRNQVIALGFMCLMHYAAMMYNARILGYSQWQKELDDIDRYVAYMPSWLLCNKMPSDFFLSSTDPAMSNLFSCLTRYYRDQEDTPIEDKRVLGTQLLDHYKIIMDSPAYKDVKIALENFFEQHIELIRSHDRGLNTNIEQKIIKNNIVALYVALELRKNHQLREAIKSDNIEINTDSLNPLIKTQFHIDLCVYFCTHSLMYANTSDHGGAAFDISFKEYYVRPSLITCMTGDSSCYNLYIMPMQSESRSSWRHAMQFGRGNLEKIAAGKGSQEEMKTDIITPLTRDVFEPHLNSNKIRLLANSTARYKDLMDLRTALPLQAMQIIDYFTRHMDLLEDRDYQFYMLFSLFQPTILDLALAHHADILTATQSLCQKGVALGDLAQSAPHLTHRGLFLLKIASWVHGYIASSTTASTAIKTTARKDYEQLEQDIHYWLRHDKRPSMQTELQRLAFYNIMKLYAPADLSLPENRAYLNRALYARFYIQQHSQDRLPGTITQAEDESFENLFFTMQGIDSKAVADVLPAVLGQLLPDQAPFISHQPTDDESADTAYCCLDRNNQLLCIHLLDGDIYLENQEFVTIPTQVTRCHTGFERIIGCDVNPLARKMNEKDYQFHWQGEEYYLAPQGFFKKINDQWYQYFTDSFLPEYLRHPRNHAWVNRAGEHALIMQRNQAAGTEQLMYHWQDNTLHSHTPEGQVCFNGEIRKKILGCFAAFEDSNLIEVILLDPPEQQRYQFHLPRYQIYGNFDEQTGVTLHHENKIYYLMPHPSPLATGIMISESKTSAPWQCSLLVPIQPFYTKKTITGSHYQLIHDIDRTTQQDKTLAKQSYATLQFGSMGKLTTKASDSTDQLYLVYLYCARYDYDKAYALLKTYSFQGTCLEFTYLHWLCEKLPAILEHQKSSVEPVVNTKLLAIKLTALAMFSHIQEQPKPETTSDESLDKFLQELPDYIIKTYAQYHCLSNNISEEGRIPKHEIEWLANYVCLYLESTKRRAQKELVRLQQEIGTINLKETLKIVTKCSQQQTEGYLAYVYAKTESVAEPTKIIVPFVMPQTTQYKPALIIPFWPEHYQPLNHAYEVLSKSGVTAMEPGKLYLECKYNHAITYNYLDPLGEEKNETIWDINLGEIFFEKNQPLSLQALNALKEQILKHAAERGNTPSVIGTLADLQKLTQESSINDVFKHTCEQLSLDMRDDLLFAHLKYYFQLINDNQGINDPSRAKLQDFCQRTIMACADLNGRLKNPLGKMAPDHRSDRLQIAIVLLRGLENPELFRAAYTETFKQYSRQIKNLGKYSIWKIISDGKQGFYSKFSTDMPFIPFIAPSHQKEILCIKKVKAKKPLRLQGVHDDNDKPTLRRVETPTHLVSIAQALEEHAQQLMALKHKKIQQYKALSSKEQRTKYDETDLALDALETDYRHGIKSRIDALVSITKSQEELKHMLVRLTEEIVDQHTGLKHYAASLPTDINALLSLQIKELGAKQLPLQIDQLLTKYALGMDVSFLDLRQLPKESHLLVRGAVKKWLRSVFLYRQYNCILETLAQLSKQNNLFKQDELKLQLAKLILELHPLKGNAALDLFQYQTKKTVRPDQWALIESLMQQLDMATRNRVGQLIMGGGKSKVILPLLAFLKADGYHLSTIEVPAALLLTSYNDLRKTAKDVFNQALELFSFNRNSPADPVSLMGYLAKFRDIIQQKKCLIMAPSSLQSLHLKWREFQYQAQFTRGNPELYEQIDVLRDILELFHERADVVVDEIHKVLDINIELNYSIGPKTTLDPVIIKTTLDLYDFLEATNIQVDDHHCLAKLNGTSFLDILNNPEVLNHPSELLTALMAYYAERYAAQHSFIRHPEEAKIQALLNAQWGVFLPLTLKQKLREQYGPSPVENISIAIPYAANNVPTKNVFANFIESLNYTTQMSRIEGIQFDVFKTVLQSWKKLNQEFLMCNNKVASEAESCYQACMQAMVNCANLPASLQGIDVANDEQLQAIYPNFQKNKPFIRYALEEAILPSIQLYRQKLTSNAINHANQVKRIQGLSGTPENHPTFDNRISFDVTTSFGTKNYLKTLLNNKATPLLVRGEEKLVELSAIIDVGAHRRGQSNLEVAQDIATQLKDTSIRYVLFFQDDQLCAWKVGGLAQDIIVLPSTEPDKIEQCLQVKPDQCFSYYDQSHATGIDLPQAPKACAGVSVDVTTTLSSFLQAVARMRLLSAGQTIKIFLSPALKEKLEEHPTLADLYQCLEQTEKNKLANDVFKAACKKLYNVVKMDLDQRLMKLNAHDSVLLFKKFQHLLVNRNPDDIIELYGKDIKEKETNVILNQISDAALKQWRGVTSSEEVNHDLQKQCDAIIQDALTYCNETQRTTLELGTEVNIEQQQQVQVELKTEVKMEIIDERLQPNVLNASWAQHCSLREDGTLTGNTTDRNELPVLWRNHPDNAKKYPSIEWSKDLLVSTQFYMTHDKQAFNRLPKDLSLKPILSTLFWKQEETVHALLICQEEAEVLAKRLSSGEDFNNPSCHVWLETTNGLALAGIRPETIEKNSKYVALKEQIYTLDGEAPLLAMKKEFTWFSYNHLALLQEQMLKQGKTSYSATFKQLEKKFGLNTEDILVQLTEEQLIAERPRVAEMPPVAAKLPVAGEPPVALQPSFFIQIMCSNAARLFGCLLLVAGITALSFLICGLAPAAVAMVATSAALFAGQFFAPKKSPNDKEKYVQVVDDMNDLNHAPLVR